VFNTGKLPWEELISGLGGRLIQGDLGLHALGVSTDSRTLKPGQLFVALKGLRFDGHDHLVEAFEKGAAGALVERPSAPKISQEKVVIQVADTLTALGDLARLWREKHSLPVVGISGSNGKTTTKEMTAVILEEMGPTLKNPGNFNNRIGLPLTLLTLNAGHAFAVLEMGMNRPGEIAELCRIARPGIGVLTNVGPAHLEGLGTLEAVARAKGELFDSLAEGDWAVVNADDERILELARTCKARQLTFGLSPQAQVRGEGVQRTEEGLRFFIASDWGREEILLSLPGAHQVSNALGAAATALLLGVPLDKIRTALARFSPPEHRQQIKKGRKGSRLIDDSYNANPASMAAALHVFSALRGGGRGGLILGDMLELGPQAASAHEEIGRLVGELGVDYLLTLGPWSHHLAETAAQGKRPPRSIVRAMDKETILKATEKEIREGDWILIKGSHGMGLDEIARLLEERS